MCKESTMRSLINYHSQKMRRKRLRNQLQMVQLHKEIRIIRKMVSRRSNKLIKNRERNHHQKRKMMEQVLVKMKLLDRV
jgi:hypothetical protein